MSRGKRGGEERAEVRTEGVGKSGSHWTALLFLVLSLMNTRHGHLFFFFDHLFFSSTFSTRSYCMPTLPLASPSISPKLGDTEGDYVRSTTAGCCRDTIQYVPVNLYTKRQGGGVGWKVS